ncbi:MULTISPECIES: 2-hydroxyacid dehydrogenase [unclassified Rhizobium]|nr:MULTISPECIES: glyoxylate/hydroxypyruvate reductase A [unclassified Rhizobium]QXZ99482.1 glyoxylate/hydroxypyruvate reductase A [Rhizobium sp. B230/85]MBO9100567.1 glyoxylate/hydroxypyruvate reductase A [Rhizobium sp. L58/93]MBO9136071.1 glyoxylate/hydroxypyruvate reductase A [Rhizobium sp. B209b/85]MBO9171382.1 glyoxylate/hydroxypyruvate reductase A [Rhizobium sp. L245/93]MBO9187249.1 glyoxylate/hydroxypyruvate reductase A [Rhizobium sp. E27B/91]
MKRLLIAEGSEDLAALFRAALPAHEILIDMPQPGEAPIDYLVVGRPKAGLMVALPEVKLILSLNAGIEHLLRSGEIAEKTPIVRMVDDGLAEGMTEWVLAEALSWHRNIRLYERFQRELRWQPQAEKLAHERIVTILGAGALGTPVARHFVAFGFKTRVWSRSGRAIEGAQSFAGRDSLVAAVTGADILVNLLPLTTETENIVGSDLFNAQARGGFFINGARGGHVVDADLIAAVDSGQLSGAVLDVFRIEPLPESDPFWRHPDIRVSPHVAAPTHPRIAVLEIARNVMRFERGEAIPHLVDKTSGY